MSTAEHRRLFMQRWQAMKEAKLTHPWAQWVALESQNAAPACRALHGKKFKVDGSELASVVEAHFDAGIKNCGCRLTPRRGS